MMLVVLSLSRKNYFRVSNINEKKFRVFEYEYEYEFSFSIFYSKLYIIYITSKNL